MQFIPPYHHPFFNTSKVQQAGSQPQRTKITEEPVRDNGDREEFEGEADYILDSDSDTDDV